LKLISAASALLLAYLVWASRAWPLIHDAPLMHYIAWLIAQGAVPYRDAFDMNLPGAYLLHLAVLQVGGPGDLAWRLFDLAWLAATAVLLWVYCRPMSDAVAAGAGAVLFGLYHLSGGVWRAGQRDFLLCLFLLAGAYGVARGLEQPDGRLALLTGGLALGAGMTVKPHAGLFWLLCAAVAIAGARATGSPAWRAGALVLGGGLVMPALVFGWLAGRGGLAPFAAVLTGYVLSTYSARKLGLKTTGNAGGVHNLIVSSGSDDFEGLLRRMGRGLVVTELMGQGVNGVTGDYSRGAAGFWVENGAIAYPVHEITIAGNLREMFRNVVAVGSDVDTRGGIRTGSVLLDDMTIAGE